MEYWALDFVNEEECEPVYSDQLYATREEAEAAAQATGRPELFDITMYRYIDLLGLYNTDAVSVDGELKVRWM